MVRAIAGKTIAEKIFSAHAGKDSRAGDIVVADVDFVMGQDGTSPLAIRALANMGVDKVFDPDKVAVVMDHSSPSPLQGVSELIKCIAALTVSGYAREHHYEKPLQ